MRSLKFTKGFSIVEVMVGLTIFAVAFFAIYQTLTFFFLNQNLQVERTQAVYLAEAAQEYVRYIRDEDWNTLTGLTAGTAYYLDISSTTIATSSSPEVIDGKYTRSFILRPVYRDGNDDMVASTTGGASADSGSYIVTTKVTWSSSTEQVLLKSVIGNLHDI